MTTITEDYVSFEIAKLLKEKGFNESCHCYYTDKGKFVDMAWNLYEKHNTNSELNDFSFCSAPTLQMTMKWLREVHNKHCDIGYDLNLYWFFQIIELKELKEHFDYSELKYYHTENETGFNTYEESVEAALKYCLENLI